MVLALPCALALLSDARAHDQGSPDKPESSYSRFVEFERVVAELNSENNTDPVDLLRQAAKLVIEEDLSHAFSVPSDYSDDPDEVTTGQHDHRADPRGSRALSRSELITDGRHVVDNLDIEEAEWFNDGPPVPYVDHTRYPQQELKTAVLSLAAIRSSAEEYAHKKAQLQIQKARIQQALDELERFQNCETGLVIQKVRR